MDAQQPSSILETQETGVVSVTAGLARGAAVGTPVNDPSNLRKRAEVIKSIGNSGLVVVAGAGVSLQSVAHPSAFSDVAGWPGLLRHGVEHCLKRQLIASDEAEVVQSQINIGQKPGKADYLIEAAQRIHDCLGDSLRSRYLWLEDWRFAELSGWNEPV